MNALNYDVVVIGAGLLGAATAAALCKSGKKVCVFEAHAPHHVQGSSHGQTRITRRLNEIPVFNETAADSLQAMRAMERVAGAIVRDVPAIFVMEKNFEAYRSLKSSADKIEEILAADIKKLGLHVADNQIGLIDHGAAVFNPEKILDRLYDQIKEHGGYIFFDTAVLRWEDSDSGVKMTTENHPPVHAGQLVIAAGGWTPDVLQKGNADNKIIEPLSKAMNVTRIPLFYYDYPDDLADLIVIMILNDNSLGMYALPEIRSDGRKFLKVGFHEGQVFENPETVDRIVSMDEKNSTTAYFEKLLQRKMTLHETSVCLYATADDRELPVIDTLPGTHNIYLSSYGGGICAKHAIALGNALSLIMQGEKAPYDMSAFSAARLLKNSASLQP